MYQQWQEGPQVVLWIYYLLTAATSFSDDTPHGTITFLQMKLAGPSF